MVAGSRIVSRDRVSGMGILWSIGISFHCSWSWSEVELPSYTATVYGIGIRDPSVRWELLSG